VVMLRLLTVAVVLIIGLLPVQAHAQSTREMQREAKRLENIANDLARCQLAAAGTSVPGNLAASQPEAAAGCAAAVLAARPRPASAVTGKCPVTGRALTKFELDQVNDFAIAKARAEARRLPVPTPSTEVANLLAC
jgi:hypothetical protein